MKPMPPDLRPDRATLRTTRPWIASTLIATLLLAGSPSAAPAQTNVFFTQFEAAEGYDDAYELIGQNGWVGEGSGGNGLVPDVTTGQGQQAYIGYFPPDNNDTYLAVWRPINFDALAANLPVVRFSVLMSIEDSYAGGWDYFRWSVYNGQGNRLFSLEFDNYYLDVAYRLDGTDGIVVTPVTYTNAELYTLAITMNFASNLWSAALGDRLLATNLPITTVNAPLNLGDVDAVWVPDDPQLPGDNYMLFDNYRLTAESLWPPRPHLQLLGRTVSGETWLRLTGQSDARFAIDATTNVQTWTALKTNVLSDGAFDYVDTTAPGFVRRFYRARWVP